MYFELYIRLMHPIVEYLLKIVILTIVELLYCIFQIVQTKIHHIEDDIQ